MTISDSVLDRLTKKESDILLSIIDNSSFDLSIISKNTEYSFDVVNQCLKELVQKGYLDDNMELTNDAKAVIKKCEPKNGIILAAGVGMRMVPINMETPKAFLEIHGERLIDRLIRQLHEVGITDITVVTGFMKDSFEYLIDEFDVKLVFATDYTTSNNLHSLNTVVDKLCNTYIIPSDIWCDKNPFRKHELLSWYMVNDLLDESSDVRVNSDMELLKVPKNIRGNGMIGISYLSGDDAYVVKNRIKTYASDSNYNDKFWEEALYGLDRMIVPARVVHSTDIVELNTYEQLRELDSCSKQLKSDALEIISDQLDCRIDDIIDIEVLKKGMTNRSFLFRVNQGEKAGKYIMRIPGEGTDQLINRTNEAKVYQTIRGLGFCDDPIYISPKTGYKITRYIEGVRCCDPEDEGDLIACMNKLRYFHNMRIKDKPLTVTHTFDPFEQIEFYERLWDGIPSIYQDYKETKINTLSLRSFIEKYKEPYQLTHIDSVSDNFLFDPNVEGLLSIQLTDWEYSGMQDKHLDIAMFCIYSMYDKEQIDHLIDIYFEPLGGCDRTTRAKIYCYIAVCGLTWSNWCEYKRNLGVEFGEYSLYQYRYSKDFFKYAKELIEEIGETV